MNNQIKGGKQKNLIEQKNDQMYGEFLPYIPGLLNWVLEMEEEKATSIVKNYEEEVPSLLAMKARTLVETNPIADWLDNKIVYDANAKTNIGVAKRDRDNNSSTWYLETEQWLYASYCEHCQNSGTKSVSLRRFVSLLSDLTKNQLGLKVERGRDRYGSYFEGLRIRGKNNASPPMITGNTKVVINTKVPADNTNVINKLWNLVMEKVTDAIDYVMDESIDSDECYECDGKNEKSEKLENSAENETGCNTVIESSEQEKEKSEEFLSKSIAQAACEAACLDLKIPLSEGVSFRAQPSHSSQKQAQSYTEQKVTDNQSFITVGDKVIVEECPAYWSWASPFTVMAIDGGMAKLEMVGELVEIERLSVIDG